MQASACPAYRSLCQRFGVIGKVSGVNTLLFWDAQTFMPRGGAWSRGEQVAALTSIISETINADETARLLDEAEENIDSLDPTERANLREMRRIWKRRTSEPKGLAAERVRVSQTLQVEWREAKRLARFDLFAPGFKELLKIYREIASAIGETVGLAPYDALMAEFDPGVTTRIVAPIFDELEAFLPGLLREVQERQSSWPEPVPLAGDFSAERQARLSKELAAMIGHSEEHSRIDPAPHPFMMPGSPGDVRFTTRYDVHNFRMASMATMHEAGHAMYELNLPRSLAFQPAGNGRGATVHESQAMTLDMQIGRSPEFLRWIAPRMREQFEGDAESWTFSNVLNSFRRIDQGHIRSEADEISYLLHILLRYKLERALFSDDLAVDDIPGAWNDLSAKLLGKVPPNDALGCLQDMHWSAGWIGYFPSYALGAALAAQFFAAATARDTEIQPALGRGEFGPYMNWARTNVHEKASILPFEELVVGATGKTLGGDAIKEHLRRRYLEEPLLDA